MNFHPLFYTFLTQNNQLFFQKIFYFCLKSNFKYGVGYF